MVWSRTFRFAADRDRLTSLHGVEETADLIGESP